MSVDARTLRRVLRQLADAGCRDLLLDNLTTEEALTLARTARRAASASRDPVTRDMTTRAAADVAPAVREQSRVAYDSATAADPPIGGAELSVLARAAAACTRCRLHESRRNAVFGEGPDQADVVVVGEAPGQEEDRTGRPFVGRAGKLLDLLLMTAGFARESVYICNVLKCRPPQNRNPLPDEVAQCTTTFLHPQLDAIAPRVLVAVGKFAAQSLLDSDESIGRLRGRVHAYRGTPLVVTYHPAYLLRSPQMSRVAWHDFQLIRQVYDEQG